MKGEFKKRYDPELGRYVRKQIYGEGLTDVVKMTSKKVFGQTAKAAAKTATKKAVERAVTKTGDYMGKTE